MSQETLEKPAQKEKSTETMKPNFGNGRYSPEMERLYVEMQKLFGIPEKKAEKIARQIGSDFGALMKNSVAEISVGKATKDGKASIGETVSKLKGVTVTHPLAIVRAIQWLKDAGKNYVSYGHTQWQLVEPLRVWVEELKVD